jgi:hypothetical protein
MYNTEGSDGILNNQLDYVCNRMLYAPVENAIMKSFIMRALHQIPRIPIIRVIRPQTR